MIWIIIVGIILIIILIVVAMVKAGKGKQPAPATVQQTPADVITIASHYLLTPISIIRGTVDQLADPASLGLSQTDRAKQYVAIQASADKLLLLVQNMLTVSMIDQRSLRVSLTAANLIEEIEVCLNQIHAQAVQKNQTVTFKRPEGLHIEQVRIDREKFRQALTNVLHNAVKFTDPGGVVNISLQSSGHDFTIGVADSGIGIAPDQLPKLCTRFHRGTDLMQLEYEGMGLGLYIAKYLLEANGGTISIASELGKGTAVTIHITQ